MRRMFIAVGAVLFFGALLAPASADAQEVNSANTHTTGIAINEASIDVGVGCGGAFTGVVDASLDGGAGSNAYDWQGALVGGPPGAAMMMTPNAEPFRTGLPTGVKLTPISVSVAVPVGTPPGTYPLTITVTFGGTTPRSAMVNVVVTAACASIPSSGTPICVESELVQTAPEAAELAVNNEFRHGNSHYQIIGGPPTCKVQCLNGFDFNCDGKTGDLCRLPTPLLRVKDVAACLEKFNPSVEATTTAAAVATPISAPAAGTGGGLAHTGAETDVLFQAALGLIALGAASSAVAVRRRTHDQS